MSLNRRDRMERFKLMNMIFKGFKLGLLLQVAVGPVFLFVLKTATESGILAAEAAVLGATMVDALFVTLAILGIGKVLDKPKYQSMLKIFGSMILFYFGLGMSLGVFNIHIIPGLSGLVSSANITNAFIYSVVLTCSSPLTILFWTGVFASKMTHEGYSKTEMKLLGLGAVLTTLVFLGIVALIAGLLKPLITPTIINALNFTVGLVLIGFSIKMLLKKVTPRNDSLMDYIKLKKESKP